MLGLLPARIWLPSLMLTYWPHRAPAGLPQSTFQVSVILHTQELYLLIQTQLLSFSL